MNHPDSDEVAQLLARAKEGDSVALDAVFAIVSTRFQGTAARLRKRYPAVAAQEGTGDLFHDALLKLFQQYRDQPHRIPGDEKTLEVHVKQVLRDVGRDLARKHLGPQASTWRNDGQMPTDEPAGNDTTVSGRAMRREVVELVHRAIGELPEELRGVVYDYYIGQGMTHEQLAQAHGVTVKTVGRWLREARGLLAPLLS
jgi:RNA polymerase sigma factor (sigma-70 family)